MEYKVLYRKYRPNCFKNIVGQEYTIKMLQNAIINNKISHAYLFTGPRGTGKTSTAKVFAKTINCQHLENGEACGKCASCLSFEQSPDIIEIDAASNNGVDDIRELINNVKIAPTEGKYKIYIIDEVHMMTASAFNAFLLTLEEPPAHAIFIMATTNVESVPITILSRCQRFNFKKFSIEDLQKQIKYVCSEENIKITDDAVTEIAYLSEGGMRDALSLLDQLASNEEEITVDKILANYGSISTKFIKDLIGNLENKNVEKISEAILELQNTSSDYKIFIKKMVQELSHIAVQIKTGGYHGLFSYEQIRTLIFNFNECLNKINININPFLLVEMILLDVIDVKESESAQKTDPIVIENTETKVDNSKDVISEKEQPVIKEDPVVEVSSNDDSEYWLELRKIRVNNCFTGAKKDYLRSYQELWQKEKENYNLAPDIMSIVLDSNIVASSEDYCILTSKLASTVNLINKKLDELSLALKDIIKKEVKFIALTEEEWITEKQVYVTNIKKGVMYQLQDEESLKKMMPNVNEMDEIATNVFSRDKIEIV